MKQELLTVDECKERLKVSRATVYNLCQERLLRHVRIGTNGKGAIRIPEEAIEEYLRSVEVAPL